MIHHRVFLYEYRKKHAIVGGNSKGRREKRVLRTRYYATLLGKNIQQHNLLPFFLIQVKSNGD